MPCVPKSQSQSRFLWAQNVRKSKKSTVSLWTRAHSHTHAILWVCVRVCVRTFVCVRGWVGLIHKQFRIKNTVFFSSDHIWHFKCQLFTLFCVFFSARRIPCEIVHKFGISFFSFLFFSLCQSWCLRLNFVETKSVRLTCSCFFFSFHTFKIDYTEFWDIIFSKLVVFSSILSFVVTPNFLEHSTVAAAKHFCTWCQIYINMNIPNVMLRTENLFR